MLPSTQALSDPLLQAITEEYTEEFIIEDECFQITYHILREINHAKFFFRNQRLESNRYKKRILKC